MAGLQLTLAVVDELPLDECLVGVVVLEAGDQTVMVSSRLNLIEGDLTIDLTGPAGLTRAGRPRSRRPVRARTTFFPNVQSRECRRSRSIGDRSWT